MYKWEGNIRTVFRGIGCKFVDGVHLAQDRDQWRALVNTVMYIWVPQKAGNLLTLWLTISFSRMTLRGCIQKFPDWVDNEIYSYLWYYSLRSNTKGYGGETHYTDSQNSDTTTPSGRELSHLQFSLQEASSETFEYTLVLHGVTYATPHTSVNVLNGI
jgi:hypothetical protein